MPVDRCYWIRHDGIWIKKGIMMINSSTRIISFSLWGNKATYCIGAIRNAELAKSIFPEWTCRFYVGNTVSKTIISKLEELGCQIVHMNEQGDWKGLFWRFNAVLGDDYEYVLIRDCDCRLSYEEKQEVDDWIESEKLIHSIIGHPWHNVPILGGLWGVKDDDKFKHRFAYELADFDKENAYQSDQIFLTDRVYPIVKSDMHKSMMITRNPNANYSFMGEPYNMHDEPLDPKHRMVAKEYYDKANLKPINDD